MTSIKAVLRKKRNKEGKYPIAFRITKERKSSYIYTGKYVKIDDWDSQNQKVKKSHPNSARLNNFLAKKLLEIDNKDLEFQSQDRVMSARSLKSQVKNDAKKISFFQLADKYLQHLEQTGKYSRFVAEKTRVKHFRNFLREEDILFQEITELMLKRFQAYLSTLDLSERSIVNNLVVIRTIYNLAIREQIVERKLYPFGKGKIVIRFPESTKIGLTKEEVGVLERLELNEYPSLIHARNVWLFSFYLAGMRVSDVLCLQWNNIQDGRLHYAMGKNRKAGSLKIPEKALLIILSYEKERESEEDYIFPELKKANRGNSKDMYRKIQSATRKFNTHLKKIATIASIDKKLTMHIARHTFGNISGDKIPIQMLQKLYRHTSITTTIGYQANFMYKDADDALDAVIQ